METQQLTEAANKIETTRRGILKAAAVAAGVAVGGSLLSTAAHAAGPTKFSSIPSPKYLNILGIDAGHDVQVLNFALLLEDLESDLYVQALQRLTVGGTNKLGTQIPGLGLGMDQPDVFFINEFAPVEAEHRDFLRGSLNSLIKGIAIRPFKYDFGMESRSRAEVLDLVLTAESIGLAAYLGAVPKLVTRAFITGAAAIQGTEARHTAVLTTVQNVLFNGSNPKPVAPLASDNHGIDIPMDPNVALEKVSPYIVR